MCVYRGFRRCPGTLASGEISEGGGRGGGGAGGAGGAAGGGGGGGGGRGGGRGGGIPTRLTGIGTDLKRDIRQGDRIKVSKSIMSGGNVLPVQAERKVEQVSVSEEWLEVR